MIANSEFTSETKNKTGYFHDLYELILSISNWMHLERRASRAIVSGIVWEIVFIALVNISPIHHIKWIPMPDSWDFSAILDDVSITLAPMIAGIYLLFAAWLWREHTGAKSWLFFGIACLLAGSGNVIYTYEYLYQYAPGYVPSGTLADIPNLICFPFFYLGFLTIPTESGSSRNRIQLIKLFLDSLLFISAASALFWYFIFLPIYQKQISITHTVDMFSILPFIIYSLACLGLLYMIVIVIARTPASGSYLGAIVALMLGTFCAFVAETGYIYLFDVKYSETLGQLFDAFINQAFICVMISGVIVCSRAKLKNSNIETPTRITVPYRIREHYLLLKALSPSLAALAASAIIMLVAIHDSPSIIPAFISLILLTTLVALRQGLTIVENQRLFYQERQTVLQLAAAQNSLEHALIREQHFAEDARRQALTAQHLQLVNSAVLDTTKDGIILISPTHEILLANQTFAAFFGIDNDQLTHLHKHPPQLFRIFYHAMGDSAATFQEKIEEFIASSQEGSIDGIMLSSPSLRELSIYSAPVADQEGHSRLGQLFVFRDVTQERAVERMKSDLVSLTSHELRSPLASITGFLEMALEENNKLSSDQLNYLETAKSSAQRLTELVGTLLDLSILESGQTKLDLEDIEINPLVHEVCQSLQALALAKQMEISIHLPEKSLSVRADRQRLYQILTNLISNALKYTSNGGQVQVRAVQEGTYVRFSVQDTGVGLSSEEQQQLFTKFFRAHHPKMVQVRGTGLGLALTKSLVEIHSGRIWVDSALNEGSTFNFTLLAA